MKIIRYNKQYTVSDFTLLNIFPDQFVSEKEKGTDGWQKLNMDYFYNVATQKYIQNKERILKNYRLVSGNIILRDFYETEETKTLTETLIEDESIPVRHYCIMSPPLNTLKGELSNRPDNIYVKAFDDDSKSEEMQFRTDILSQFIFQNAKERMVALLSTKGEEVDSEEEIDNLTAEKVEEYMVGYTSLAERWGSNVLEYMKMRFNLKEKSEEAFNDLLITGMEYFHIYEDNSDLGFNIEVLNPKNTWSISTPDTEYISNPLDPTSGSYAAGTVEVMELSEVLYKFNLPEDIVKHLRNFAQQTYLINSRTSNLVSGGPTGVNSITYNTYDPLVLQYRQTLEAEMMDNNPNQDFFASTSDIASFGNKYLVIRAYWCSKKRLGKLVYIDKEGVEQIVYVDDNYKKGMHPQEVSLDWGWINQWYQGIKIGPDVYDVKPLDILEYCPIFGVFYELKNLPNPVSLVDRMKEYQMLYNATMNQLFNLLEKDMGVVMLMSQRHVPNKRDGDEQDALEIWEEEARNRGIVWIDDSPENLKAPSAFNQFSKVDLSRSNEIQARYNLAVQIRTECWRLVGLSEQRLGATSASETATGINTAISQSYAQTEPYFAKHGYLMNRVYQGLLDAALYMQSQSEESILANISSEGANQFVKVNGSDLKLRNLGVFVTSRSEDNRNLQELKQYGQAMLQNGASPYEIAMMHDTKSIREVKDTFKRLKDKMDAFQQQQQEIEKAKVEQAQQQFEQAQQLAQLQDEKNKAFEAYQAEQERLNKLRIAMIQAQSKAEIAAQTTPDTSGIDTQAQSNYHNYQLKLQELTHKQEAILTQNLQNAQKMDLEKEKLKVQREKIAADILIAKENKTNAEIKAKKNK